MSLSSSTLRARSRVVFRPTLVVAAFLAFVALNPACTCGGPRANDRDDVGDGAEGEGAPSMGEGEGAIGEGDGEGASGEGEGASGEGEGASGEGEGSSGEGEGSSGEG